MINSTNERVVRRRPTARRVALAGLLTTVALTGGAGVAAAADAPPAVETGYATVVETSSTAAPVGTSCPDPSATPDATTPEGNL